MEWDQYLNIFLDGYRNYASYLWYEISHPSLKNYFYGLIVVSLIFFALEWLRPWRKDQSLFRKDFWLDAFYMFFNFFLFSLLIYNAASDVVVEFFNDAIIWMTGFDLQGANPLNRWPMWSILIIGFVVRDFVQWWTHRLLHSVDVLWNFHKVHHSVREMGFAAHLRYHWMETIVYRSIEYIPLALLGIGLYDFFLIHMFTLAWGHYNHANFRIDPKWTGGLLGMIVGVSISFSFFDFVLMNSSPLALKLLVILISTSVGVFGLSKVMYYLFNSPEMHIWHHSYQLPEGREKGINFGLTLAIWDYIFGTAHVPHNGRDIELGFPGVENFPEDFQKQAVFGLRSN